MRNGTEQRPDNLLFPKEQEMSAYDALPQSLRDVVRAAPFDVSVMDMLGNAAVMAEVTRRGDAASAWLAEQFDRVYHTRILPNAFKPK